MCIVFLYVNNQAGPGTYSLIFANNRDEHYERPTKPAHFWSDSCVGGLDEQPGRRAGGTWLGVSKHNKLSTLLNILQPDGQLNKKGRGHLVTNYLSGSQSAHTYLAGVSRDRHLYNKFNLLCLERTHASWRGCLFSNDESSGMHTIDEGYTILGNSVVSRPWQKTVRTRPVFEGIVKESGRVETEEELRGRLIGMLSDTTPYYPDAFLSAQGPHLTSSVLRERSAVCVDSPSIYYGSRTNTVILVDAESRCSYTERTMREPINAHQPTWDTTHHTFQLTEPAMTTDSNRRSDYPTGSRIHSRL